MKLNINGNVVDLDIEAFNKAVEDKAESFDIKSDDLVIRSTENQNLYEENLKKEVGDYKVEIGRKEVLNALGIENEGKGFHKSVDKSIGAINDFINQSTKSALEEAGKAPDGKIKELTTDLETLRSNLLAKDSEIEAAKGEFNTYKKNQTISNVLMNNIPENTILPKSDIMTIVKSQINLDIDDNGNSYGLGTDGQPIKDADRSVIGGDNIVKSFFDNNPQYLKPTSGGAGGGDSTGEGGKIKFDDLVKQQAQIGNSPASAEFKAEAARLQKDGTLDMS
tara:strand:- start:734 stop:1570 length:837 start_codon:yes stop_codon:yes gene_type:complete